MKILVGISRVLVGLLFIISGLIKLNDPIGFSFKLKEYFAPDVLNLEFLMPYALLIAIFLVIYEVLLGIMLLIGYLKKFTLWSLLLMIVFFTFLTFYSAYFNKVTDCGCFGDAIKLTPWESFTKDIILLVLILVLFVGQKFIIPFFSKNIRSIVIFAALVGCLAVTFQVLQHLPIVDFRPYKIGANISDGMKVPPNAPAAIYDYNWKFKVDGKEKIITTTGDYPKSDGEFLNVETELVQAGYEPPIHDFTIEKNGEDFTTQFLNEKNLVVVIAYSLGNTEKNGFPPIKKVTDEALKKGYKVIGLSASADETTKSLLEKYDLNFQFYFCDETTLKTIVRSNPGILELQNGTIKQKLHWNDVSDFKLETLENSTPTLNLSLKKQLDSISKLDQKYRILLNAKTSEERKDLGENMGLTAAEYNGDLWAFQAVIDSSNLAFIERVFKKNGYPGKTIVGEPSNEVAWNVLQHNPEKIEEYLPIILKAGEEGELPMKLVATMQDRYLMNANKPQIYGTQAVIQDDKSFIWPIDNPETVNERRKKAGFENSLEDDARTMLGADFQYQVLTMEDIKTN